MLSLTWQSSPGWTLLAAAVMLLAVIALIVTIHPLLLPLLGVATLPMLWEQRRFHREGSDG